MEFIALMSGFGCGIAVLAVVDMIEKKVLLTRNRKQFKGGKPQILDTLICEIKIFNSSKKLLKEETINMNVVIDNEGGDEKCQ